MPESCTAYQLAGDRLETLHKKRGTGGIRVTLEDFGLSGMVFFAQDALIVEAVKQRAEAVAVRRTELQCSLADQKYRSVVQAVEQLARHTPAKVGAQERLDAARKALAECNRQLAARQYATAAAQASQTVRPLRLLERAYWQVAMTRQTSPVASPGTASFATLPWHWDLLDRLAYSRLGPNLLPGGDFEQLGVHAPERLAAFRASGRRDSHGRRSGRRGRPQRTAGLATAPRGPTIRKTRPP